MAIIESLPDAVKGGPMSIIDLEAAGENGRLGLDCTLLYGAECPAEEWRFVAAASGFPASPEASRRRAEAMLQWAFFRKRFKTPL